MFGARLKEERLKIQLSQEKLADYLDVQKNTIWNWEKEKSYPNALQIMDFLDLGLDIQYILTGSRSEQFVNRQSMKAELPESVSGSLTPDEQTLLDHYRQATPESRHIILTVAQTQEKKADRIEIGKVG